MAENLDVMTVIEKQWIQAETRGSDPLISMALSLPKDPYNQPRGLPLCKRRQSDNNFPKEGTKSIPP